jgi:Protein of unknown function (DUF2950)
MVFVMSMIAGAAAFSVAPATAQEEADASGLASYVAAEEPQAFDEPGQAVDALRAAFASNDFDGVAALLGLDAAELKTNDDVMESYQEIRDRVADRIIVSDEADRKILLLGRELWPFPFPISKTEEDTWAFDTYAGLDEIIARRVGENELTTIATVHTYVETQREYASADRDGDGVLEYAQKLLSTPGETDGLYWPADQGDGISPAGPFVDETEVGDTEDGYFGYRYKILKGQGDNIAGGSYDYVINGNMIGGFALVAWPANYGVSGVHTFVVSHHGIVYERDLGDSTDAIVPYIDRFNPDDSWDIVGPTG